MSNWAESQAYQDELNKGFSFGKYVNPGQIAKFMRPSQDLISEQLGTSRQLMDPRSQINQTMKDLMTQRAAETGQQQMGMMSRMAAQTGMSPGQAMQQAREQMSGAMSNVNQDWMSGLQGQFSQGLGLMGNMTQMQGGLGEMYSNAYLSRVGQNMARKKKKWYERGVLGQAYNVLGGN